MGSASMSPRRMMVGPGTGSVEGRDHARGRVAGRHRERQAVEGLEHPLLREGEVEAELRVLVQGAPQADGFGLQVLGFGEQGVGGHEGMVRPARDGGLAGAPLPPGPSSRDS